MANIIFKNRVFTPQEYTLEADFEGQIVSHASAIFGESALYIDVKKRIGDGDIVTIPDGYLLDFSFPTDPRLYIIENELAKHDPYKHIGQQLLKFAISYKVSGRRIKKFLLHEIMQTPSGRALIEEGLQNAGYRNIDAMLEDLIFEKPVAAIVIIDMITPELENVLAQLSMNTDILEFQSFANGREQIHRYSPFQQDLREPADGGKSKIPPEEIDTIVVPALEEGFREVFLGENCWHAIRISSAMVERIKWIAAYQTAPVSAITHVAPVDRIERFKRTSKYIVHFAEPAHEIAPITFPKGRRDLIVQSPRYTSFRRLSKAKTLSGIFQ